MSGKVLWRCSGILRGCKANIISKNENPSEGLEACKGHHNHERPQYHQMVDGTWIKVFYKTSARGKRQLVVNGFAFICRTYCVNHIKKIWKCASHSDCTAKVHTIQDQIFIVPGDAGLNLIISDITSGVTQDNSDDDVIEVVRDEAPIEILSDGEEYELIKKKHNEQFAVTENFQFSSLVINETKEDSYLEKMDTSEPVDPLKSFEESDILNQNPVEPAAPLIHAVTVPVIAHSSTVDIPKEPIKSDIESKAAKISITDKKELNQSDQTKKDDSSKPDKVDTVEFPKPDEKKVQTPLPDKPENVPNDQVPNKSTTNKVG
ncbi:uncharacterized protein LOC134655913 [Cydia amplana]|uniref:uncharacterized protein LOC134655913 n=1 Tax=Cydia amplana TaxID=1869771 RepID=UPI002FE558BC